MNVICTQAKQCEVLSLYVDVNHRKTTVYESDALFRCIHRSKHQHTPLCETKCCDQVGIVKCRNAE